MKTNDYPPRETGGCVIWITIFLLLLISMFANAQNVDLRLSKVEKTVLTTAFTGASMYFIVKPGCSKSDKILAGTFSGLVFLVNVADINLPEYMEVNSSGINFKLRNKRFKCYVPPYKKKFVRNDKNRVK